MAFGSTVRVLPATMVVSFASDPAWAPAGVTITSNDATPAITATITATRRAPARLFRTDTRSTTTSG